MKGFISNRILYVMSRSRKTPIDMVCPFRPQTVSCSVECPHLHEHIDFSGTYQLITLTCGSGTLSIEAIQPPPEGDK